MTARIVSYMSPVGLRVLTRLTINTHKCPYWYVYARLPALIIGDDDLKKENLKRNPERKKRKGKEQEQEQKRGILVACCMLGGGI